MNCVYRSGPAPSQREAVRSQMIPLCPLCLRQIKLYDTRMSELAGTIAIRVRYAECDPMGVAHHTAYPVWFEIGRTELLRSTGNNYRDLEANGILLAVVSLVVKYKRPARYDDLLSLKTVLRESGRVKIQHDYELTRDGILLATASTTLACLDRDGRLRHLPDVLPGHADNADG